jgi:hypothetical protein
MISLVGGLRRRQRISFKAAAAASGPAFRSASSTTTITGVFFDNGFTLAAPTGTAVGDVLLMQMFVRMDSKSGSAGNAPAGWTLRGTEDPSYALLGPWRTYTRVATGTDSFVWSGGYNWETLTASMIAVSGGTAVDVVGASGASALTAVAPSVTTTTSPTLLVGLFCVGETAISAPASMTSRINTPSGPIASLISTQTLTTTGATGTRTCPTSSFSVRYSQLIAVK